MRTLTLAPVAAALATAVMVWSAGADTADESDANDPYPGMYPRMMEVAERANLHAGPGTEHVVISTLNAGVGVQVTGDVENGDWLRVDLGEDNGTAFIRTPLLKATRVFGPEWLIATNQLCLVHSLDLGDLVAPVAWLGACVDGKASGEGRLSYRDAAYVYEGSVRAGKPHGYGTVTTPDGRYEGEVRDGKIHGFGTFTTDNGDRYEGEFRDHEPNGYGTYVWTDGNRYEGEWRAGKPHGNGTYTLADGDVYQGHWRDGCFGERDGRWIVAKTTVEACGFE